MSNIRAAFVNGKLEFYKDGVQITLAQAKTEVANDPKLVIETNKRSLESKANTALTSNTTYLALASPTTAQNTAQIKSLTRQNNAVIRLLLKKLDTTTGT